MEGMDKENLKNGRSGVIYFIKYTNTIRTYFLGIQKNPYFLFLQKYLAYSVTHFMNKKGKTRKFQFYTDSTSST